jgi:integral membrane sensor domain MASE1
VRDLGPAQLGIGSGMSATTRQLGAVLGVAILVAILGPVPGPSAYDAGWWAMAAVALLAVAPITLIGRQRALAPATSDG